MTLKLMYITNDVQIAKIAEKSGVDWIFVDLEIKGKDERQGHLDTVISRHHIDDVRKIKSVLKKSKVLVRVNPLDSDSEAEINRVIEDGADIVMLPFFKTVEEVQEFIEIVDGRSKVMLLLETPEAVVIINKITKIQGIDYIHIGLNDLHLGYKKKFMFELLSDGTVENICEEIKRTGINYGFGGIARLGEGILASEYILGEHYRLESSMVILSRSFCNMKIMKDKNEVQELFDVEVAKVRKYEGKLQKKNDGFFTLNKKKVFEKIEAVRSGIES